MAHFALAWWWMLCLLPLPLLIHRFAKPVSQSRPLYLAYLPETAQATAPQHRLASGLRLLIWILLLLAAARPVWYGEPVTIQPKHRDLMLVVDLSGSMAQPDMRQNDTYIDRLSAVKQVLNTFIEKRTGDRIGLVLFADHAYLQTPLTLDRHTVQQQLNSAELNLIGAQTAIGEGIGLATKTFIDSDAPQRVIILLSDGSNNAGVLEPLDAAKIAQKHHTTIYTVGVGAGEMQVQDFFMTRTVNTAADLDETTLTKIAELTGGRYFRARDSQQLNTIYDTINQLEPVATGSQTWRPMQEWFSVPLSLALLLSVALIVLRRHHV